MSDVSFPTGSGVDVEAQAHRLGEILFGRRAQPKSPNEALQPQPVPPPPPPPKKRRRSPILSALSGVLSFVLLVTVAAALFDISAQRSLRSAGPLAADKIVMIPAGSTRGDIADQLEGEGVIASKLMFNFAVIRQSAGGNLRAGEYVFKQQASLQDTLDTLVSGKAILHSITIPEGLTSEQIINRLKENDILVGEVREIPKEGSLLPETYKFARGLSRDQILQTMAKAQKVALDDIWKRRASDVPVKSSYELVTLASIVEKETGRADERPHVASVFSNRLGKRMKLQSDPTIIYGLVGGKGTLGRGILRSEVEAATPYNTYVIEGLPPGPIANPGKAAMEAVANPSRTKDLFFVADGTGGHAFAETLDQHNKNVVRWRQLEKDAKEHYQPAETPQPPGTSAPPATPTPPPGTKGGLEPDGASVYGALPADFVVAAADNASMSGASENPVAVEALRRALGSKLAKAPTAAMTAAIVAGSGGKGADGRSSDARVAAVLKIPVPVAAAKNPVIASAFDFGPVLQDIVAKLPGLSAFTPNAPGDTTASIAAPDASLEVYPVSASRRADQKARAALYGVVSDAPFSATAAEPRLQAAAETQAVAVAAPGAKPRQRFLDVSEGTALDPLRNHSFDLTTAKTLPAVK